MDSPGINRREGSEGRTEGWDGTSSGRQQDRGGMKWINDSSTRIRCCDDGGSDRQMKEESPRRQRILNVTTTWIQYRDEKE
ncbi:unnamed protein product [Caenorhabditis nigoni]